MASTPETWPVGLPTKAQRDWQPEKLHLPTITSEMNVTMQMGSKRFTMPVWLFNEYVTRTCKFVKDYPAIGQQAGFRSGQPLYPVAMKITIENMLNG